MPALHPILRMASCHAANLDASVLRIVDYLRSRLEWSISVIDDIDWPERYARLDNGTIDVAWICGAPYVQRMAAAHEQGGNIELLAAPIWRGERYAGRAVYYADLVVQAQSRYQSFADLRGATWVYNEPASLSGFVAMQAYLAGKGEAETYFGASYASGGHLASLAELLAGHAAVTTIDSVVLAEYLRTYPDVAAQIRRLDSVGPLPSMPWVASLQLAGETRTALREALLQMSADPQGRAALQETPLAGFAAVADSDYDPIRTITHLPYAGLA